MSVMGLDLENNSPHTEFILKNQILKHESGFFVVWVTLSNITVKKSKFL
jgi:hypothetical protein